jgi:hypothetical protein
MKSLVLVLLLFSQATAIVAATEAKPNPNGFLIDPSKPYVYLKFDHIGDRERLPGEESSDGLWLRLVNNCRIPILVATFNYGAENSVLGVYHDVVRVKPVGPSIPSGVQPETTFSDLNGEMPRGYPRTEMISTTTITPGSNILFSVPRDHVRPSWYLQMRFYFELQNAPYGFGPYSVLSFVWQDIAEKFRQLKSPSAPPKPTTH